MKKNDMNLLERYRSEQKRKSNTTNAFHIYILLIVASILILGAFAFKLVLDNNSMRNEIAQIKDYIERPVIVEKMNSLTKIQSNLKILDEIEKEAISLESVISYKPRFDSKIMDVVYYERPSDVKFDLLEYEENTIILNMTGKRPSDFSNYALRLQRTYQFADVSYEGYTYNKDRGLYEGSIRCIMKGGN